MLQGKVAVVTGAGTGIGVGISLALAAAGASIVVSYHSNAAGAELAAEQVRGAGAEVLVKGCDVRDHGQVQALFDATLERFGRVDILINNSGITEPHSLLDMTPEAQVLLVDPLWYIDEARHECGPLELNIADGVVKQLLQAPPLRAEHLPRVRKQLNAMNHAVALPEDVSIRRLSRTAPVPVLQLLQAALLFPPGTWYAQPTPTACALLSFDYGGVPVDPRYAEGDELRFVKDGTLFSVPRDHEVEQAATARMKELGFASPVLHHNLGDEHLPGILFTPNGIVGNQDGREQWQKFLVQDLEPLRAAGWRIDMRADFPMRLVVPENWKVVVEEGAVPGWFDIELGITVKGNEVNLLPLLLTAISRSADTFSLDRLANVDDDTICNERMCIRLMQIVNRFNTIWLYSQNSCKERFFIRPTHHTTQIISKLGLFGFCQESNFICKTN